MELGAIGEKARRAVRLGKLGTTLAGVGGGVILWRNQRFACRRGGKRQEGLSFVLVKSSAIEPLPGCDQFVM
jgi:hypothetical protein